MKLTRKQLGALLNHADSPYIRGLGFMYIRFCLPPVTFWDWYEPYLEDEEVGERNFNYYNSFIIIILNFNVYSFNMFSGNRPESWNRRYNDDRSNV